MRIPQRIRATKYRGQYKIFTALHLCNVAHHCYIARPELIEMRRRLFSSITDFSAAGNHRIVQQKNLRYQTSTCMGIIEIGIVGTAK